MSRFNPTGFAGTDRFGGGGIANPNKPALPLGGVFARDRGAGITGGRPKTNERRLAREAANQNIATRG